MKQRWRVVACCAWAILGCSGDVRAQLDDGGVTTVAQLDIPFGKILQSVGNPVRSVHSLLDEESFTTNLADALPESPLVSETWVVQNLQPEAFETLPVGEDGFRLLKPGYYYRVVQTY